MSFGLGRGRQLDPGAIGITADDLGPLPDDILTNPAAARIDPRTWFPDPSRPLEIEIGSGKGTFLLQAAAAHPGTNFLGIEWAREFYQYAADRCRRRWGGGAAAPDDEELDTLPSGERRASRPEWSANVRLLNADAVEFLHWRCPGSIAQVIHLYFSDPWPKTKHNRRRVLQDRFLADAYRILQPGGELRIVTDHEEYWAWMEEHFARWTQRGIDLRPVDPSSHPVVPGHALNEHPGPFLRLPFTPLASTPESELVGTNFERKYRREGRPFHAAILRKP